MIPDLTKDQLEERLKKIVIDAEKLGLNSTIFNLNGGRIFSWAYPKKLSGHDARILGARFKKMVKNGKVKNIILLSKDDTSNPNISGNWGLGSKDAEYATKSFFDK